MNAAEKTYCDLRVMHRQYPSELITTETAELVSDPGAGLVCVRFQGEFIWVSSMRIKNRRNHR